MSKIAKFGCEMLENAENIALQSLQILYTFVLRAEIATISGPMSQNLRTLQRLYFPHFTTFRNRTLQFY
jgi:hypothetical protein